MKTLHYNSMVFSVIQF